MIYELNLSFQDIGFLNIRFALRDESIELMDLSKMLSSMDIERS